MTKATLNPDPIGSISWVVNAFWTKGNSPSCLLAVKFVTEWCQVNKALHISHSLLLQCIFIQTFPRNPGCGATFFGWIIFWIRKVPVPHMSSCMDFILTVWILFGKPQGPRTAHFSNFSPLCALNLCDAKTPNAACCRQPVKQTSYSQQIM